MKTGDNISWIGIIRNQIMENLNNFMKLMPQTLLTVLFSVLCFNLAATPTPKSEDEALFVRRIAEFWKDDEKSIVKFQLIDFLRQYPNSDFADNFRAILGDFYWNEKAYQDAYESYRYIQTKEIHDSVYDREIECLYLLKKWNELAEKAKLYRGNHEDKIAYFYAEALYHLGDEDNAQYQYERLLSSSFRDRAAFALSEIHLKKGNFKRTAELYLTLADEHPEQKEQFLYQAGLLQKKYDPRQALETFARMTSQDALFQSALVHYDLGEYQKILDLREKLLKLENQVMINFIIGRSYFGLNQFQNALDTLKPLLDQSELKKSILLTLIVSAHHLNYADLVETWSTQYENSFFNDPDLAKILSIKAASYYQNEKYQQAELTLLRILHDFPKIDNAETLKFQKTVSRFKQGLWKASREEFQAFLTEYPRSTHSSSALHYCSQATQNQISESKEPEELKKQLFEDIQKALAMKGNQDTNHPEYLLKMAHMLCELKQYGQANSIINDYLERHSRNVDSYQAYLLKALCCREETQDLLGYANNLEKALSLKPMMAETLYLHRNLFTAYLQLGDHEKAANHLYSALNEKKEIPQDALIWLANYYYSILKKENNEYLIEPLEDKKALEYARKGIEVYNKSNTEQEAEIIKYSHMLGWAGRNSECIAILQKLKPSKYEAQADFALAQAYLLEGNTEAALPLFIKLCKESNIDRNISSASQLYLSRLAFSQMPQENKQTENPEVIAILSRLKNLQIRKTLAQEPIHLEAAIDYAMIRSSLEPPEKRVESLLTHLIKAKENFVNQDDLCAKDYHASRQALPAKDTIYQAYILFLDARIAQLEAQMARKKGMILEAERKDEVARTLDKTLKRGKFKVSNYLNNFAQSDFVK